MSALVILFAVLLVGTSASEVNGVVVGTIHEDHTSVTADTLLQ